MKPIFQKYIKKINNLIDCLAEIISFIKSLPDGEYDLIITKHFKPKSKEQRGYYRGVLLTDFLQAFRDLFSATGHSIAAELINEESLHEHLKKLFNNGESTENLGTIETEDYYRKIREYCYEKTGVVLRLPNETSIEDIKL